MFPLTVINGGIRTPKQSPRQPATSSLSTSTNQAPANAKINQSSHSNEIAKLREKLKYNSHAKLEEAIKADAEQKIALIQIIDGQLAAYSGLYREFAEYIHTNNSRQTGQDDTIARIASSQNKVKNTVDQLFAAC